MNLFDKTYPLFVFGNVLAGLALALALGALAIWFARRTGLMDIPGVLPHKEHKRPTPLAGGLTLLLCLAAGGWLGLYPLLDLWKILVPALIVFAFGLWDDYRRLPAWLKFIGQLLAGVVLIALGISVSIVQSTASGPAAFLFSWINPAITLFWIVGVTNAFNLIDSMDGIVAGIGGIAIGFLALVTIGSPQVEIARLMTFMLGICFGLYFLNSSPARMFLGDSGAQTIGFLLAAVAILFTPGQHPQASSWFLPILVLGLPIFDTTLVVFSRLRRGQAIYRGGLDHTYHRLVALGLDGQRAVVLMHLTAIALGCVAFIALRLPPLYANLVFGLVLLAGLGAILFLESRRQ